MASQGAAVNYWLGVVGSWLVSDAIYSYCLYCHGSQSWRGDRQTWARDHWVRAVRLLCGLAIIVIGASLT